MGANAQTTVPTFTAAQVLTAEQQNQSARTGVPVFATTGTRDAGFGGTGEKTLAEGQLCYVEGTGLQTYNGTSWVTWGTAPSTGALVFITSATFTTASTVSMASGVFTSTYKTYKVILHVTGQATGGQIAVRVNSSGTPQTTANYRGGVGFVKTGGAFVGSGSGGTTSCYLMNYTTTQPTQNFDFTVYDPTNSSETTSWSGTGWGVDSGVADFASVWAAGHYGVTEANDGLTFITSAGTITGTYQVYGMTAS